MDSNIKHLGLLGRCLAPSESAQEAAALGAELSGGSPDWEPIIALTNEHLLPPALFSSLRAKGLDRFLDDELKTYLNEMHRLNTQRNAQLREQAHQVVSAFNEQGIEPLMLKGGAYLFKDIAVDSGLRVIGDLDILVAKDHLSQALHSLYSLGYRSLSGEYQMADEGHHYSALYCPGYPGLLELHVELTGKPGQKYLPRVEDAWKQAKAVSVDGLSLKVLSPTHSILLNVVHSQIQDGLCYRASVPLRQLFDFVVLSKRFAEEIDWREVANHFKGLGCQGMIDSYLMMAHKVFRWSYPSGLRKSLRAKLRFQICVLAFRSKLLGHLANLVMMLGRVLSSDMIQLRYKCSERSCTVWKHRIKHLFYLTIKSLNPKKFRSLVGIGGESPEQLSAGVRNG